jgi:uncharacterized membrane protein YdjX (TVP38/TMEM64 family)
MKKLQKKWIKQIGLPLAAVLAFVLLIVIAMTIWREPIMALFNSREQFREMIDHAGGFGPFIYIIVQILQIIVAPIPGQVVGIIGGVLFGWLGIVYNLIGSAIGFYVVFKLARRFGRPLAEKFFPKKVLKKFDFIVERQGVMTLFLIFLLPFFPDDAVCYLAGLTAIPIRQLMLIAMVGRLPAVFLNNFIGLGMSREMIRPMVAVVMLIVVISAVCYYKRKQLHAFVSAENHLEYLKKHWPYKLSQTIFWGLLILLIVAVIFFVIAAFPFRRVSLI